MKKILITGAHSFIGNALKDHLARFPDQYEVNLLSLRTQDWKKTDFSAYDCVVHAAGIAHVSPKYEMASEYLRVNRDLTLECASRAREGGVSQFIFLSSIIVYGGATPAGKHCSITADTPLKPENAYGQSKLEAEAGLFGMERPDFRVAVLRPPMIYGRGCKGNYRMLSAWAKRCAFFPNFPGIRSVLYVGNLVELIRLLIDHGDRGLFFPQNRERCTSAQLVREIARAQGRRMHLTRLLNPALRLFSRLPLVRRAFGDFNYAPDMSVYPQEYQIYDLEHSVRETEAN